MIHEIFRKIQEYNKIRHDKTSSLTTINANYFIHRIYHRIQWCSFKCFKHNPTLYVFFTTGCFRNSASSCSLFLIISICYKIAQKTYLTLFKRRRIRGSYFPLEWLYKWLYSFVLIRWPWNSPTLTIFQVDQVGGNFWIQAHHGQLESFKKYRLQILRLPNSSQKLMPTTFHLVWSDIIWNCYVITEFSCIMGLRNFTIYQVS